MTTNFTAKNGVTVTIDDNGYLLATTDEGMCHATGGADLGVEALREFFQHERDAELGRWRDPEDANMVVYRVPESDDKDGRAVRVIDEATGTYASLWERDTRRFGCGSMHATAARYFAAHPEPRPWHSAQPGDVWLLTINGEQAPAIAFLDKNTGQKVFATPTFTDLGQGRHLITGGHRIWPTGADDE